jgi:CRISPR-associated protein Cas5h
LGLAQFTATIDYIDTIFAEYKENINNSFVEIVTAVNLSKIKAETPVEFDYSAMYSANNMPVEMNKYREVQEYSEILIEKNGLPVRAKVENYYYLKNYGNILFL